MLVVMTHIMAGVVISIQSPQWTMTTWNKICGEMKVIWKKHLEIFTPKEEHLIKKEFEPNKTRHTVMPRAHPQQSDIVPVTMRYCVYFFSFEWKIWELVLHWFRKRKSWSVTCTEQEKNYNRNTRYRLRKPKLECQKKLNIISIEQRQVVSKCLCVNKKLELQ
jgi:hypothetical protein